MPESDPFLAFRYHIELKPADGPLLCDGRFSEISGLEATMSPRTHAEGGHAWGERQLPGRTTFATVVLKRGITDARGLWSWFAAVNRDGRMGPSQRPTAIITVRRSSGDGDIAYTIRLLDTLPVRLVAPGLDATASSVAIEELHLVHQGLEIEPGAAAS